MGYLVLARKWRPSGFGDLVGQGPAARVLKNSIVQGKIAHAYIFSGPRGVGKTSMARILAKALNCEAGPTPEPCGKCDSCRGITGSASMDVMEIDGASNNGVNDVRELRDMVKYAPSAGRYKVYIIDEAHMLSESAFNALLKTLEEPPAHVVFVMATTEPKKIPLTVFSRCQHLPFRRISATDIRDRLEHISSMEGLKISRGSLEIVARAADGSMRDSLTMLDQIASVSSDIEEELVMELLGITGYQNLAALLGAVIDGRREEVLEEIAGFADRGADARQILKDIVKLTRDLLVYKLSRKPDEALEMGEQDREVLKTLSQTASSEQVLALLSEFLRAETGLRFSSNPRVALEVSLLKASYFGSFLPVGEALRKLGPGARIAAEYTSGPEEKNVPSAGRPSRPAAHAPAPKKAMVGDVSVQPDNGEEAGEDKAPEEDIKGKNKKTPDPAGDDEPKDPPGAMKTAGPGDAGGIFAALAERAKNPMVISAFATADVSIRDGKELVFSFPKGMNTELFEEYLKKDQKWLEEEASALFGAPLKLSISAERGAGLSKKDLRQKAASMPFTREALDLFDGKVVDVNESK